MHRLGVDVPLPQVLEQIVEVIKDFLWPVLLGWQIVDVPVPLDVEVSFGASRTHPATQYNTLGLR